MSYTPNISPKTRDVVYIAGLIVSAVVGLAVTTVSTIVPDVAGQASEIGTGVLTATGILVAGLGVVYRPGAQSDPGDVA